MSLQSKKNLVKIQPNKKSVKSSLPRRSKVRKSRSKTELKSKRSLRATSQRPTVSKKKSLKQSGGNLISFDKFQELIKIKEYIDIFTDIMENESLKDKYFSKVGGLTNSWLGTVAKYLNPQVLSEVKSLDLFYASLKNSEPLKPMNFDELVKTLEDSTNPINSKIEQMETEINDLTYNNPFYYIMINDKKVIKQEVIDRLKEEIKEPKQEIIKYHKQFIIIVLINIIGNPLFAKCIEEREFKIKKLEEEQELKIKLLEKEYKLKFKESFDKYVELLAPAAEEAAPAAAPAAEEAAPAAEVLAASDTESFFKKSE